LNSETLKLIHQAYGDYAMRRAAVLKLWKRFRGGETKVKNQNHLFHYPPAAHFQEVGGGCKKCIACQRRFFGKQISTAPP
jgi:hypothetical protein